MSQLWQDRSLEEGLSCQQGQGVKKPHDSADIAVVLDGYESTGVLVASTS